MSLLVVVGVTSIGLTFSGALILLEAERKNNFFWALERLKELFMRVDAHPRVIVSDRDIALMNAITVVFSEVANVLCCFYIDKNVKAKCKMIVHPKESRDQVMEAWGFVVDCDDLVQFKHRVEAF